MKIKTVCDITGLTDRTIRFYIEEELIAPTFQENYLGRRNYDFSNKDVIQLQDISVLRKFGFSIAEIKKIVTTPEESETVLQQLIERKQILLSQETEALEALLSINAQKAYTLSELAKMLTNYTQNKNLPKEDSQINIRQTILHVIKNFIIFTVFILPFVCEFLGIAILFYNNRYPQVNIGEQIIFTLISLIPSIIILVLSVLKKKNKKANPFIKIIAIVICVTLLPISMLFQLLIPAYSETTNIQDYRRFDAECFVNRDSIFQDLFPLWPRYFKKVLDENGNYVEDVYLDSKYHYRYIDGLDYTYDVYAEWELEKSAFDKEVDRVHNLFEEIRGNEAYLKYEELQKGTYNCLILWSGSEKPFTSAAHGYDYYIFAYDVQTNRVRYIYCASMDIPYQQPIYLNLDW